jgi:hypothetical protein
MDEYNFKEHVHRFAAWAAGRAGSTSTARFSVESAKSWLERAEGLKACVCNPNVLPETANEFDEKHRNWRNKLIADANNSITHGIAAKLINIYLKAAVVHPHCAEDAKVGFVHPPIDRLLLGELRKTGPDFWRRQDLTWSKFNSEKYEEVISKVRRTLQPGEPLWKIEEYWKGNQ